MGNQVDNKFTWVIKNFCSEQSVKIYSDEFVVDGCKWRLLAFPKGNNVNQLSLYLEVVGSELLPAGWRRNAKFHLTIVNPLFRELSVTKETTHWFDASASDWGFTSMLALKELREKHYLVTGGLTIVVKVSVLEVIGNLDVTEESEEKTKALRNIEENDTTESNDLQEENDTTESNDLHKEASAVKECMDVNGFRVLPSQVESVRCIFERHPDVASKFRPKNAHLRSSSMNVLLSLIETICQSTKELSKDDLADAYSAFGYLMALGLNLDWLEEKLEEVSEKKEIEEAGETRIQGMEEELKELKQKCLNLEAQLKKEREDVSVARAPLRFDDVV